MRNLSLHLLSLARFSRLTGLVLACLAGCGFDLPPAEEATGPSTVVLTFDDGPIAADIADPASAPDADVLLASLRGILDKLDRQHKQAVFYIKGPGNETAGNLLLEVYTTGLSEIAARGQVLGYHAYNHAPEIWIQPFGCPPAVTDQMNKDIDQLLTYIDTALAPASLERPSVFVPVFRPPYGAGAIGVPPALEAAQRHGLTFHGFRIDSMDWCRNADADPKLRAVVPVDNDAEYASYVRGRLRQGVRHMAGSAYFDVVFHVNAFTAAHLDGWITELDTALRERGEAVPTFGVPADYLITDDPFVDLSSFPVSIQAGLAEPSAK